VAPNATYVLEAGRIRRKASPKELAKLVTARDLTRATGGELVVVSSERLRPRGVRSRLLLHLRAFDYRGPDDLRATIRSEWERRDRSIREVVEHFGREESPEVVLAAAWAAAGDLARAARLLKPGLDEEPLSLDSRIRATRPGTPLVLPSGLITDLDELVALADELGGPTSAPDEDDVERLSLAGSVIDPAAIPDAAERDRFERRLAAAHAHEIEGVPLAAAARRFGLPVRGFQRLYARSLEHGQAAFYAHASYGRPYTTLPEQMVGLIRKLYSGTTRPTATAVAESLDFRRLTEDLELDRTPSRRQVSAVITHLMATDHKVRQARAGRKHLPFIVRGRSADVESRPAFLVELDEETFDVLAVTDEKDEVTVRLHVGVLICVGTRNILAAIVSPKSLDQWDLRRLLLRAMLPKDALKAHFGLKNDWPSAMVAIVSTDNGRIMTSALSLQAAAEVPFVIQFVPIKEPTAKPYVESFFGGLKDLFEHRLIVSTGSSPDDRGRHDPAAEAIRRGITPAKLERALLKHVADVYHRRFHRGLRKTPAGAWRTAVDRLGVRTWQGSADELRRLLKRDEGVRLVVDRAVSYLGRWYGDTFLDPWGGKQLRMKVDDDDLRTVDVYTEAGVFLGAVRNDELARRGRPVSRWELDLEAAVEKEVEKVANAEAVGNAQEVRAEADGAAGRRRARTRLHRERADETATQSSRDVLAGAPPPIRRLPASLAQPVADDDTDYDSLEDLEVTDEAA
jgi:hypothetical protein